MTKHTKILFFILIAFSLNGYSQNENFWLELVTEKINKLDLKSSETTNFERMYRIWTSNQVIELTEIGDSTYSGQLINFVTKTYRKSDKNEIIKESLKIPQFTVMSLIDTLYKSNIETLPDCEDVDGYVSGLDGINYIFEIILQDSVRVYSYWEPMSDYYQNDSISEVRDVRSMINSLKSMINTDLHISNFIDRLDKGSYNNGGTGLYIIK